jgi:hypothetical protein
MTKKTDYVAWGLDDATPSDIDQALEKREKLFKKVTNRLDRLLLIVLLSTVVQLALVYQIYTNI